MLRYLLHAVGRLLLTLLFGITPIEKISDEQCIVIANHNTHLDTMVLFRLFPLKKVSSVRVVAAKDHFSKGFAGIGGRILFNMILLDRHSKECVLALNPLEEALKEKYSLIMFPEGTRGEPGVLQHFKSGIGKIAVDFPDIPVYPVYIKGVERTIPRGSALIVPFNISLEVFPKIYGRDFLVYKNQARKKITLYLEEIFVNAIQKGEHIN